MRAKSIKIHNFRSYSDVEINLAEYSLLVGANNSGKSNLIDAIRVFYEKDIKYDSERDFPKFLTKDKESWIEIEFHPSVDEFISLKSDYQKPDGTFRVRKYLQSDEKDDEGKNKSDIYAYVDGQLSNSRFYGAKNVQQGKFGKIIYIPAVSKLDDHTKLSGPSALRDLINVVLKKILISSPSYRVLQQSCEDFGGQIKSEQTTDGQSLQQIEGEISSEISSWGASFELFVNPISSDDIVKLLIGQRINDQELNQTLDPKCFGQGFQRNLIFSIIKLSSKYQYPEKTDGQKEFSPQLTWILFEEPEAFLHPSQIQTLDNSLQLLSKNSGSQVLISTHNPVFVSLNIEELPSLVRINRENAISTIGQISNDRLDSLLSQNLEEIQVWKKSGIQVDDEDLTLDMESIKYALWLDPKRCSAFFAQKVLLVEGPTETTLFRYLQDIGAIHSTPGGLFFLDTFGKFNTHRFMNILGEYKILHAAIFDDDNNRYQAVDNTIKASLNPYTLGIQTLPSDLETFLKIKKAARLDKKPQHVMWQIKNEQYDKQALTKLVEMVNTLLQI